MTVQIAHRTDSGQLAHPIPARAARGRAAALLTVGALLQVVEFVLEPSAGSTDQRIAWWADHPTRIGLSQAAGIVAIPFLIGGFWTMARLTRQHSRRLTAVAVTMLTGGMVGLADIHGVEMTANWLVQAGHTDAATAVLEVQQPGVQGIAVFVLFLVGAMIGCLLLLIALARSPYVPRLAPLFLAAFMVLDFAVGMGVAGHLAGLASGAVLAWAVVTGYVRTSPSNGPERGH
jgi:membrane associated rhomboid family serine protease